MAAKPGQSLSDMMAADLGQQPAKTATPKKRPAAKAKVVKLNPAPAETAPAATPQEIEKVTVYLPKAAYRFIKQTALELEKRPHDLLMQGVEMMLTQHGKSLKDFTK